MPSLKGRHIPHAGNWFAIDIYEKAPVACLRMSMGRFVVSFYNENHHCVASAIYEPDTAPTKEDLDFINSVVMLAMDSLGEMT